MQQIIQCPNTTSCFDLNIGTRVCPHQLQITHSGAQVVVRSILLLDKPLPSRGLDKSSSPLGADFTELHNVLGLEIVFFFSKITFRMAPWLTTVRLILSIPWIIYCQPPPRTFPMLTTMSISCPPTLAAAVASCTLVSAFYPCGKPITGQNKTLVPASSFLTVSCQVEGAVTDDG